LAINIGEKVLARAKTSDSGEQKLTRNEQLVFGELENASMPLSAYTILDGLRPEGMRAPLQIYRALEKLVALGKVHKLESLNAFVACSHPHCGAHSISAFGICDKCEAVFEIADDGLSAVLQKLAKANSFVSKRAVIELRGLCASCQEQS
jgi:Fur family transcriptional regulator, zinc uptake regulator